MITLFGVTMAWTTIIFAVVGVFWVGLGVPFAWVNVRGKWRAYKKQKLDKDPARNGFVMRQLDYWFGILLRLVLSPVALIFWLGERSGKKNGQ